MALERHPDAASAMLEAGWEIASHGYRWIDYQYVGAETEREHMQQAIAIQTRITGSRPLGWYTGRNSPNTLRLVVEEGGFVYCADSYADDLPYWHDQYGKPPLIIPYTLDANDMRFGTYQGFNVGDQFYTYLKDTFDMLYQEGASAPWNTYVRSGAPGYQRRASPVRPSSPWEALPVAERTSRTRLRATRPPGRAGRSGSEG